MSEKTQETLVCRASTLAVANQVRHALIDEFDLLWFYLYKNGELYVTTDFGAKLSTELFEQVNTAAQGYLKKFSE